MATKAQIAKPAKSTKAAKTAKAAKAQKPAKRARKPRVKPTPEYAQVIYDRLAEHYPDAKCALVHDSPYQLIVATILSAQCTDKRVNMVTPALFKRYPTPRAMAAARLEELEQMSKSTGFFRNKAKSLLGMA